MDTKLVKDLTTNRNFLFNFIREWNESRLDMFALSQPNEKMEFSGVMRFYFQESGQKATTKCIRVTNVQTVTDIMPTLIDKFCPDLKMLSMPNYELYEIHGTGDVRRISPKDRPLLVQLNWHTDDREGRFVLKNADVKIQPVKFFEVNQDEGQLKRRLSRREKKDLKKKRKEEVARNNKKNQDKLLADKVYRELPESSLTRTISNPEAVMRRRRQQKLEKRMKEFQNKGGPQTGGILKIFAESLKPEIPYKTILASVKDNADVITKSALEKFLLPDENPIYFCIVMAIIPPGDPNNTGGVKERIIRSSDCPLAIQNSWPRSKGVITFHLRRKDDAPENTSKIPKNDKNGKAKNQSSSSQLSSKPLSQAPQQKGQSTRRTPPSLPPPTEERLDYDTMPYFLELTPEGKEISYKPKICHIRPHETVIGSSRNPTPGVQYLQLFSPKILASHCSIVNEDGCVSIVPHGPDADVRISAKRIFDITILSNGNVVQFGGLHTFRFCNPLDPAHSEKSSLASEHGMEPPYRPPNSPGMGSPPMSPISPELKEKILNEQIGSQVDDDLDADVAETTFGVDGGVETEKIPRHIYSARSAENLLDEESVVLRENFRNSFKKHRQSAPNLLNTNLNEENLLPAALTFLENGKDAFFAAVISEVNGAAVNFKLAPTYTLYLVARHVYSPAYRPGLNPIERSRVITSTTKRIATSVQQTIQENDCLAGGLAFWMANASELLHFYRQDMDLGPLTQAAQAILAQSIQESFALLVNAMEDELALALPAFLDPSEDVDIHEQDLDAILNDDVLERAESIELLNWNSDNDDRAFRMGPNGRPLSGEQWIRPAARIHQHGSPVMADVLYILSSAMSLLRRCRVNAALTIQLFSQLFHYINMWIFNRIVLEPELYLCTQMWGHRLRMRLNFVEAWAERQGLELAADCHLARIVQAAFLLESPKDSPDDVVDISQQCFKLNSLQLRCLLQNYRPDRDEPRIPQDLIETIVAVAESTADELTISDGREVKLEEDVQLQLPFLLPEEGYSSDIIRGVPPGLQEFLEPLCGTGLCELSLNPASMGLWTVYQEPYEVDENEDGNRDSQLVEEFPIERVTIDKGKSGLGLSICAAKGVQSDFPGIYIKAVIKGGLADQDGRLEGGDQILSVNESSLIDVTQTQAAKIMSKSGSVITLEVMKGAAFYHGLAKLVEDHSKSFHGRESSVDSGKPKMQKSSSRELLDDNQQSYYQQAGPLEPALPRREEFHSRESSYDSNSNARAPPPIVQPKPHKRGESYDSHDGSHDRYNNPRDAAPPPIIQPKPHQRSKSSDSRDLNSDQPPPVQQKPHQRNASYDSRENRDYDQRQHMVPTQPKPKIVQTPLVSELEPEIRYNDSDYDSDGNIMTPDEKSRRARQQQRQREYEERLAKWEEERKRKEEEENAAAKAEADARRQEEDQRLAEEEANRQYEEEVQRRKADDARIEEEMRLEAEARTRQEEEEKARFAAEKEEMRRKKEKEEQQRQRDEEERRRKDEEDRRREIERRRENELRKKEKDEEEKRQKEDEKRRQEVERRRSEEQKKAAEEREELKRRHLEERKRAADEKQKREREEEEERRRLQEKQRLVEERKRREADEEERKQQTQRENEERRRRDYERELARRQAAEQQKEEEEKRRRRQKDEEQERQRQREYETRVSSNAPSSNTSRDNDDDAELDDDIAGINEAIREAEKIAAEMDLFMMEEEIKIEEGSKQKRQEERSQWDSQVHTNKPTLSTKPNTYTRLSNQQPKPPSQALSYRQQTAYKPYQKVELLINNNNTNHQQPMKRSSSRENLLETNLDDIDNTAFLPPPPEDLLDDEEDFKPVGNPETNIDSSDDDTSTRPSRAFSPPSSTTTSSMTSLSKAPVPKYDAKRQLKQNDYAPSFGTRQSSRPAPPVVRPKSFKPPIATNNTPAVSAVKGEFKIRAENDYERRRQTLDKDFSNTQQHQSGRKNSSDEDAPPRPPPPKSVTPSPRSSMSPQFTYANGHQDYSRSYSIGKRPDAQQTSNGGSQQSPQQEPMDFRTKMKMFNKH